MEPGFQKASCPRFSYRRESGRGPGLWTCLLYTSIFTRIKEEIGLGKTVQSAIKSGFNKALSAIIDGNVTTLIAAGVLFWRGSGTVKGFASTLAIGIVLSMITALFITKFILNALDVYKRQSQPCALSMRFRT